jgi:elongation factor G
MSRPSKPVLEIAVEPRSPEDEARLHSALDILAGYDERLEYFADPDSGLTVLRGESERHLDGVLDKLIVGAGVAMNIGRPQAGYREALREAVVIDHLINAPTGSRSRLTLLFEPADSETAFEFADDTPIASFPLGFVAGLHQAFEAAAREGAIAGFPFTGLRVRLSAGYWRDGWAETARLKVLARDLLHQLVRGGKVQVVEPIMQLTVTVCQDLAEPVKLDLLRRCGQVDAADEPDGQRRFWAEVPLANLIGYGGVLAGLTGGSGDWSIAFERYAEAPQRPADAPTVEALARVSD